MEAGLLGNAQRLLIKRGDIDIAFQTAPATSNLGVLSIGDGPWDGLSIGKYAGSSLGTIYAANAASGYSGNLIDLQIAGTSEIKVDASGNVTIAGNLITPVGAILPTALNLTSTFSKATANTSMGTSNTFFDGPSISLAAGSWLIIASCCVLAGTTATKVTGRIWDGTAGDTWAEGEMPQIASSPLQLTLVTAFSFSGASRTYKMSVAATNNKATLEATCPDNGTTNTATWIIAIQVG